MAVDFRTEPDLGRQRFKSLGLGGAFRRGLRESPTGLLAKGLPEEDLDLPFWEDVARGIGSFVDPISLASFFAGGGLGGAAARKLGVQGLKSIAVRKGVASGARHAGGLGLHAGVAETARQKAAGGPYDFRAIAGAAGKSALTGLALGPVAAIPGVGPAAKAGRFAAESAVFAGVPAALEGRLPTGREALLAPATLGVAKAAFSPLARLGVHGRTLPEVRREFTFGRKRKGPKPVTAIGEKISHDRNRPVLNLDDLYAKSFDDLNPFKIATEKAKKFGRKGFKLDAESDPFILARNSRGYIGKASDFLENDLAPILKSLKPEQLQEVREYVTARRLLARPDIWTPKKLERKGVNRLGLFDTMKEFDPKWRQVGDQLDAYAEKILGYGLGKDSLDFKQIRASGEFYQPMHESFEPGGKRYFGPKGGQVESPIKRLKGEAQEFVDPLESITKNTIALVRFREQARVGEALVDMAEQSGVKGIADPVKLPALKNRPDIGDPAVKVRGKWYRLDGETFGAMQNLNREALPFLLRMANVPAKVLRIGATTTPEFGLRNPFRDVQTAMVISRYGFKPTDFFRGLFEALRKGEKYQEWRRAGGEQAALLSMDRSSLQDGLGRALAGRVGRIDPRHIIKHPIETARIFSEWTETATRLGEHMRARRKGAGPREAAFESRDLIDFARMGPWFRQANSIIAFFNPHMQGVNRVYRAFKENPARTTMRVTAQITIPSILLSMHNRKNDPDWKARPDWQKNIFWMVPLGRNKKGDVRYAFLPKPFELGVLFGSVPERMVEWIADNDETEGASIMQALGAMTPDVVPTALNPAIEVFANRSRFRDAPIVPRAKEGFPAELQTTRSSGRTVRELGKKLGYSPAKLEHLVRGYTGGLGRIGLDVSDAIFNRLSPEDQDIARPTKTAADIPVLRAFTPRFPSPSSQNINDFYEMIEEDERLFRARKELDLGEDKRKIFKVHAIARVYKKRLGVWRDRALRIEASKRLTGDQKREQLDDIYRKMDEIAREALAKLRSQ